MKCRKIFAWCREAVRGIWYGPDRDAVHKELLDHAMERYEHRLQQGLTPEEAEVQTVCAMGDPQELCLQLRKIHNSFWPRMLLATRWTAVVLLIAVVLQLAIPLTQITMNNIWYTVTEPYIEQKHNMLQERVCVKAEGYTFTVTRAQLTQDREFCAILEVESAELWIQDAAVTLGFWATDSNGEYHASALENPSNQAASYRSGIFRYTVHIRYSIYSQELPQWMELHYDRSGRDIVLRLELKEALKTA